MISGYEEQNRRILGKRKFQSGGRKQRDRETNLHDNGKEAPGDVFKDFVKEDVSYSMSAPAKRLFSMMYMGNFTEGSLDATISAITKDEKIQRTLKKKLKGKYEKDTETLMKLVGLSEQEASDWAYLASEVINWEWMLQILKAAEWGGTPQEAVEVIRAAIFVDEGIKVTVEAEK